MSISEWTAFEKSIFQSMKANLNTIKTVSSRLRDSEIVKETCFEDKE